MAEIEINGGRVVYEFVGPDDGEVVVLTPGGRFSKDHGGVPELAEALAAGGRRVLLWDRPNCGASDVQLFGISESHMRAETLGALVRELGVGPVVAAGGSGGARDTILFTMLFPELVTRLAVWSIVGGTFSTMSLAGVYVLNELRAVRTSGIEGVLRLPGWAELVEANPRNRDRLLAIGAEEFERVMTRWLEAYVPKPNEAIPGVPDWQFADIAVPTLIIRGGEKDFDHPKRTSFEVHALIKESVLVDPPWPEDAWERAVEASFAGKGSIFDPWRLAAPLLLDFFDGREVGPEALALGRARG
ncbi:alpha/beta fold hydrolase [Actinomadura sp. LD22]|uniref:Alpha/beta fold hydrolase n=1 Tax=Actinomadura physcomitrii TaxID=2650748 RepID=A0A6I4M1Z2_9ACTN|nr:alpha/beta hydrolase [Actinomadura physcomitrii]MVZ99782.1 alpha/beta fold hydrolase [Actinomadura physcomitrii]